MTHFCSLVPTFEHANKGLAKFLSIHGICSNFSDARIMSYFGCPNSLKYWAESNIRWLIDNVNKLFSFSRDSTNFIMWPEMQSTKKLSVRHWTLPILILSFTFLPSVLSFNVDVGSKVVHTAPRDSCDGDCMFGFSVAQHRDQGTPW